MKRRRSPEANQTLHDVWASPGLDIIYIFGGSCPLTEFCPVQNSLYVQLLRCPILAALLHGTPAAGVSQTLRRGTRNGITELSQTASPIFGWAAITFGIGHILVVEHIRTRMWANAQRDGRPAEYGWRPLFNAAKFG